MGRWDSTDRVDSIGVGDWVHETRFSIVRSSKKYWWDGLERMESDLHRTSDYPEET